MGEPVRRMQALRLPRQTGGGFSGCGGLKIQEKSIYNREKNGIMPTMKRVGFRSVLSGRSRCYIG